MQERYDGVAGGGRPWTPRTRSQVASISKQLAAAVTLLAVDRGALVLDDTLASLLPDCPAPVRGVSVRQLLTHTSGIRHWCDLPGFDPQQPVEPADRLRRLLRAPLADLPGQSWRYSSPGYLVLAGVLEAATGRAYADLVRDGLLAPLGLAATTVGVAPAVDVALGHRDGRPVPRWPLDRMPGTGDVWSTARDLARFLAALYGGELLPAAVRPLLHDVHVPAPSAASGALPTSGYGLGHFRGHADGQPAYVVAGDNPGYRSLAAWLPATGTVVVALSNDEGDDLERVVVDLVRAG